MRIQKCLYKIVIFFLAFVLAEANAASVKATPVLVAAVRQSVVADAQTAIGTVIAPKMASLSMSVNGHIKNIMFKNGQEVKKGALLIELDDAAELAELAGAKAKLAASLAKYRRYQQISSSNLVSKQTIADAKSTFLQDQADANDKQVALDKRRLTAPFAGTVGAKQVSIGAFVTAGQPLVALVNTHDLQVSFKIPENQIPLIQQGMQVSFTTPLFPRQKFLAKISFIAPAIDQSTRTLACLADVSPTTEKLRPGLFVQVNFAVDKSKDSLEIPEQALVPNYPNYVVYRVINNQAVKTAVTIGQRHGGWVVIRSGLRSGEQVVISGQSKLRNGQAVQVVKP